MKILLGYDGSGPAHAALNLAIEHAKVFGAEVVAVNSLFGGNETTAEEVENARVDLEKAKATLEKAGVSCETHLLIKGSSPGEDIVSFAEQERVDEIIIGIKRKSKVGKLIFGSTAQYVIIKAPCPVMTVK